ncbi:MAG TPA: HAMP domain-containing sensor histidine kinase, partial [Xanthobacteraceae bacterium]|nr:HAMP domain-containing sensor histidine kinase [Xanthobacteraceae bacterium]
SEIIKSGASVDEHTAYGRYIHEAGSRLLGILNDVLTLARIEAGKLELDEQIASLDEVLSASVRARRVEAEAKSITIRREPGPDNFVFLDPSKMKQAFDHLLSNAVKFTATGGDVSIATAVNDMGNDAGKLVVTIRDTGCGIPADYLDRVLEPFGQVEDHLTRENEGVGLGLPLARAIAGLHGGTLSLSSELGVGTAVAVALPSARLRITPAG